MRIVSLLPAATEIVWALGLEDDLVGVSHACDFPPAVVGRPVATLPSGAVDGAVIASLRPDLVFAGAGARDWEVGPDAAVVVLDPASLEGIFHSIATVGAMTAAEDEAVGLVEILRERLADVEEVAAERGAGGWEVLGSDGEPSAPAAWEAVAEVDPEMLLLVPRGMHLREATRAWRATPRPSFWPEIQAVRRGRVFALDAAAYFSRPGPRVIDGIEILAEIFDPDAFVDLAPAGSWVPVP